MQHHSALVVILSLCLCPSVLAQPVPSADREVMGLAIRALSSGGHRLDAAWTIHAGTETSVPTSAATAVQVRVNGLPAFPDAPQEYWLDGCSGSADCPLGQTCLCDGDGNCQCEGNAILVSFEFALAAGDTVEVELVAMAGSLPDENPSNNVRSVRYQGDDVRWDRRIVGIELVPRGAAPDSFFDVIVDLEVAGNLEGLHGLGAELELVIDGASIGTFPSALIDDLFWSPCANVACDDSVACVMDGAGGFYGTCQPSGGMPACQCLYHPEPSVIPNVPIPPGTVGVVILRPVPGALPELPPFPGEPPSDVDEIALPSPGGCLGDLDDDGDVDFGDLIALLAAWGPCAGCPADLDADDEVGFSDLIIVLAAWGPCA